MLSYLIGWRIHLGKKKNQRGSSDQCEVSERFLEFLS